jgi:predicted nucleotide-binding protein
MPEKLTRPRAVLEETFERIMVSGIKLREGLALEDKAQNRYIAIIKLTQWDENVRALLEGAFTGSGPTSLYPTEINTSYLSSASSFTGDIERVQDAFGTRLEALASIRDMLGVYEEPSEAILAGHEHPVPCSSTAVFIVHGHSGGPKEQVARFLEQATNTQPVILHEQARRGQTIIESLEAFAATAAFAIVLLTGDDRGGLAGSQESHSRARQNVVFELGFFIGALGRSRVAMLYEEAVELPSDMNGILYTTLDSQGAWKQSLGRELRAAGFTVDLNEAT